MWVYRGYDITEDSDGQFWVELNKERIIGPAMNLDSAQDLIDMRRRARVSAGLEPVGAVD